MSGADRRTWCDNCICYDVASVDQLKSPKHSANFVWNRDSRKTDVPGSEGFYAITDERLFGQTEPEFLAVSTTAANCSLAVVDRFSTKRIV